MQTGQKISELGLENSAAVVHPEGTVMLSRTASIGFSCVIGKPMATTQAFVCWTPNPRMVDSDYLHAAVKAMGQKYDQLSYGATHLTIYFPDIKTLRVPCPPLEVQKHIATFLKRELAKIESLISEQQNLIDILQEKRQAVISHAVTKGLNPDAPTKPSGVEWLGEVPAHWDVTRVGWTLTKISYGYTNPMPTEDDGPFLLTANDIAMGHVQYESARRTSREAFDTLLTAKSRPKKGDILLTKDGTLGRVAIHDGSDACINQSVALLRPKASTVSSGFLVYLLMGGIYQARMIYEAGGTAIKHIYISRLAKMPLALPPQSEQQQILDFLRESTERFDGVIEECETSITLLEQRRNALISAAVTGKIDVRNRSADEAVA